MAKNEDGVWVWISLICGLLAGFIVAYNVAAPSQILSDHKAIKVEQCDPCHNDWRVGIK